MKHRLAEASQESSWCRRWTWALGTDTLMLESCATHSHTALLVTRVGTVVSCAVGKEHPPATRVIRMREKSERMKST